MIIAYDATPELVSPAGVGRYAAELRRALAGSDGVELEVMSAGRRPLRGALDRAIRGVVREAVYYPVGLPARARRRNADAVHCPAPFSPPTGTVPLVVTVHDMLPFRHPELFPRVIDVQARWLAARTLRRADRLVAVSSHTRDEAIELLGIDPGRVTVVLHGVEPRFRPAPPDRQWLRDRFGVEGPYVLCVGTLEPRKNLVTALRAFRAAAVDGDCELVVAGGRGWRNEAFEQELRGGGCRVRLAGRVDDDELVRLYSGAACFLFPSLGEGFGLPVLEAMACGAPVVCSDRTSLPEVAGDAALLVDPTEVEAVADALRRVLESPALAADLRARGSARSRSFTWQRAARETIDVYREAVASAA